MVYALDNEAWIPPVVSDPGPPLEPWPVPLWMFRSTNVYVRRLATRVQTLQLAWHDGRLPGAVAAECLETYAHVLADVDALGYREARKWVPAPTPTRRQPTAVCAAFAEVQRTLTQPLPDEITMLLFGPLRKAVAGVVVIPEDALATRGDVPWPDTDAWFAHAQVDPLVWVLVYRMQFAQHQQYTGGQPYLWQRYIVAHTAAIVTAEAVFNGHPWPSDMPDEDILPELCPVPTPRSVCRLFPKYEDIGATTRQTTVTVGVLVGKLLPGVVVRRGAKRAAVRCLQQDVSAISAGDVEGRTQAYNVLMMMLYGLYEHCRTPPPGVRDVITMSTTSPSEWLSCKWPMQPLTRRARLTPRSGQTHPPDAGCDAGASHTGALVYARDGGTLVSHRLEPALLRR